jgi:hypothetical protein
MTSTYQQTLDVATLFVKEKRQAYEKKFGHALRSEVMSNEDRDLFGALFFLKTGDLGKPHPIPTVDDELYMTRCIPVEGGCMTTRYLPDRGAIHSNFDPPKSGSSVGADRWTGRWIFTTGCNSSPVQRFQLWSTVIDKLLVPQTNTLTTIEKKASLKPMKALIVFETQEPNAALNVKKAIKEELGGDYDDHVCHYGNIVTLSVVSAREVPFWEKFLEPLGGKILLIKNYN